MTITCHGCGRKIDPVVAETGRLKYPAHENYMKTAECPMSGYEQGGEPIRPLSITALDSLDILPLIIAARSRGRRQR